VWFYILGPQPPEVALPTDDPGAAQDISEARAAVKMWPFRASKWGRLGLVLNEYGLNREAIACFERAAQLSPKNPRWPYLQGSLAMDSDMDAALALFVRSVEINGNVAPARLTLAETLLWLSRTDEAAGHFEFVLKRDPKNARALLGMGRVALERGDYKDGLDYLKRSAAEEDKVKMTHDLLADVYLRMDDPERASKERALAASLPQTPTWPDPYFAWEGPPVRGHKLIMRKVGQLLGQKRAEDAIKLLNRIPEDSVHAPRKEIQLGRAYVMLKDFESAEKSYREALRLSPEEADALLGLGGALEKQGKYAEAIEPYRKAIRIKTTAIAGHYHLAICLEKDGKTDDAIAAYRETVRLRPALAPAYKSLGTLLHAKGQDAEALTALERACQLMPKDEEARRLLDVIRASQKESKAKDAKR
jgi:tetratricopeptide (TPR) repeat protein